MRHLFLIVLAMFSLSEIKGQDKATISKLSIEGKGSKRLPDSVFTYTNLHVLELKDFRISRLPKHLKINRLVLINNNPSRRLKLPKNDSITHLIIRGDKNNRLPRRYDRLKNLKTLDLNNNTIKYVSKSIIKLKKLEHLSFYRNELKEVPEFVYDIKTLRALDLYYNHLKVISPSIKKLDNLEVIYLAENELTALPDEIGELSKLWGLYAHHNLLTTLPLSISKMTALGTLRINNNYITKWPDCITPLSSQLSHFDCSWNQMKTLPIAELDFSKVTLMTLDGNPWEPEVKKDLEVWAEKLRKNGAVISLN